MPRLRACRRTNDCSLGREVRSAPNCRLARSRSAAATSKRPFWKAASPACKRLLASISASARRSRSAASDVSGAGIGGEAARRRARPRGASSSRTRARSQSAISEFPNAKYLPLGSNTRKWSSPESWPGITATGSRVSESSDRARAPFRVVTARSEPSGEIAILRQDSESRTLCDRRITCPGSETLLDRPVGGGDERLLPVGGDDEGRRGAGQGQLTASRRILAREQEQAAACGDEHAGIVQEVKGMGHRPQLLTTEERPVPEIPDVEPAIRRSRRDAPAGLVEGDRIHSGSGSDQAALGRRVVRGPRRGSRGPRQEPFR